MSQHEVGSLALETAIIEVTARYSTWHGTALEGIEVTALEVH